MYEDNPDSDDSTARTEWDSVADLITSLLTAVADETGTRVSDLPPLNDFVDPDAMESLLTSDRSETIQLSFNYTGVRVHIDSDGYLFVQQRTGPTE
ncbi:MULTISPECIES: HalOD1 output domain-containing protein [Haloarcula]|uniref:Halobacterial output domain-containing protein n=1 Tax=Haloarcula pellucida TaxID=1427151 RepID=A0A830GMI6_9EURY|nr:MULTISPECIES: HalOD1 output domain-containing protein [Halomicroarcula]MBX0347892.1 hypothetical protein [Halomicroarcula pellucida]MDS0279979.1 hypothetical protein [Halomicroarcula sp. S1AR25-4]GGN95927.1 hypothetical protein GCM10009030_23610 [Halomicroarcula pellucida]